MSIGRTNESFDLTSPKFNEKYNEFNYNKPILISGLLVIGLSVIALTLNTCYFHFIGNNYFPETALIAGLMLLLILFGTYLQFNQEHPCFLIIREILFFYVLTATVVLLTNAVQYTPFTPIDSLIVNIESAHSIHMPQIITWTAQHPLLKQCLEFAYASLAYQMILLPLIVIFSRNLKKIRSYYFLILVSALIGFSVYYFYPTTAPASQFQSPFFSDEQRATGIKFNEIHQYLTPSTMQGGMIAFPSFHIIWGWFCLYLSYGYRWLFIGLLPLNGLLFSSCVLLGWHYPLDLVGAAFVILASHLLHGWLRVK